MSDCPVALVACRVALKQGLFDQSCAPKPGMFWECDEERRITVSHHNGTFQVQQYDEKLDVVHVWQSTGLATVPWRRL